MKSPEILLIEDNRGDVLLLEEAFRDIGFDPQLAVAGNGADAVDLLRRRTGPAPAGRLPDLIVLDLNLPRKGGKEVLAELKADPALAAVPVLILTSSGADQHVVGAYGLPESAYLIKPAQFSGYLDVARQIAKLVSQEQR